MRIQQLAFNFAAPSVSPWMKVDYQSCPFNGTLVVSLDTGAALTLTVNYLADDWSNGQAHDVFVQQTTTTVTVSDAGPLLGAGYGSGLGHGLLAGDAVELYLPGGQTLFSVAAVTNAQVYTCTSAISQTIAGQNYKALTGKVIPASANEPIIGTKGAGMTARTVLTLGFPVYALQLQATVTTTPGVARMTFLQSGIES